MSGTKNVLSLLAHPDDAEFMCAGTMALLRDKGWNVHIATMTPGDGGSAEYNREDISRIRRAEGAKAAAMLGGSFEDLQCDDVFIMYDRETLLKAVALLRKIKPAIIFAPSPSDYFMDHEITSKVVWTACFAGGIPNVEIAGVEPFEPVPHLYYVDPVDGVDKLGNKIESSIAVDVTEKFDLKMEMLCCHESQRNWLMTHHGMDEYTRMMRAFDKERGEKIKVDYAEGFRQHLGNAFPKDNILKTELGDLVYEK